MKKLLFTLTILAALLFASSCQSDWDNGFNGGGTAGTDGFRLNLNVSNSSINTRMNIPSEEGEDDITMLHLLFFEGSGAQTFVDAVEIKDEDGDPLDLSMPLQVRFHNTPTLNNNTHYKILVVANIDTYLSTNVDTWLSSFNGVDFNTAVSRQLELDGFNASNRIASNRLLMTATVEKPANREDVSVPLVRAVVRLDVEMATRLAAEYTLVSASVWNVPRETSIWNDAHNNYSNIISGRAVQRMDGVVGNTIKGQLYTFGNRQTSVSQNDLHTTAVVLGIEHNGVINYYRVNVSLPFSGQDLARNTVHNVTVNLVLGDGVKIGDPGITTVEEAERAAYGSNNSLLQVTVNNTDMDSRGVILIDGGNVLVIPTNRIVFSPEGGMREFTIFSYSPDGSARLGVSAITMDTGLLAVLAGNSLTVSATPSVDERKGFIELVFGNIRARIEVIQESSSVEFLELNLNMNDISTFPNGAAPGTVIPMPMETPDGLPNFVQVTASSEWVATMYNDEYFGFFGTTNRMIFGDPNINNTFRVQALQENEEMNTRFGFVIVSLVSNPNINRVLVLRQEGTDIVSVFAYDDPTEVLTDARTYFTARGAVVTNRGSGTNKFRITHSEAGLLPGDAGVFFTSGGTIFKVETEPGASNTETILTVTTIADYNSSLTTRHSGRIGLRSPQGGFAEMNLEQGFFTFSVPNPATERVIPRGGGSTSIVVTATETSGPTADPITTSVNWSAVFNNAISNIWHNDAMIVWGNTGAAPSISNATGTNLGSFIVTYPRLRINQVGVSPTSTVTVGIDGTGITLPPITVRQTERTLRQLNILSAIATEYSSWSATTQTYGGPTVANRLAQFGQLRAEIGNAANWGADTYMVGTFIISTQIHSGTSTTGANRRDRASSPLMPDILASASPQSQPANRPDTDIYIYNSGSAGPGGSGRIREWSRNTPGTVHNVNNGRVLIFINNENIGTGVSDTDLISRHNVMLRLYNAAYTVGSSSGTGAPIATNRTINAPTGANTSAIHNFLFRDGPFTNGTDISGDVVLRPATTDSGWLTAAPASMQRIVIDPRAGNNNIIIGICPVDQILYVGDPKLLGTGARTNTVWSGANEQFVRNLAAWVMLSSQYGQEFQAYVNALYNARMNP
jgi:hypothetical protein